MTLRASDSFLEVPDACIQPLLGIGDSDDLSPILISHSAEPGTCRGEGTAGIRPR